MTNDFSSLEIQLIRSSLTTKSDEEIAELLERPVEEVHEKINELTSGGAAERSLQVVELKQKVEQEKQKKKKKKGRPVTVKKERIVIEKKYEEREIKTKKKVQFDERQRRAELENRQTHRKYKTRAIDYGEMKSVRVNKSTWIWVPKEMDEQKAIEHYHSQRDKRPEYLRIAELRMSNY